MNLNMMVDEPNGTTNKQMWDYPAGNSNQYEETFLKSLSMILCNFYKNVLFKIYQRMPTRRFYQRIIKCHVFLSHFSISYETAKRYNTFLLSFILDGKLFKV